jgi:hypothetical protein
MDCSPYLLFTFQKPRYARSALNRSLVAIDSKASAYGKARGNRYNSLANAIDPRLDSGNASSMSVAATTRSQASVISKPSASDDPLSAAIEIFFRSACTIPAKPSYLPSAEWPRVHPRSRSDRHQCQMPHCLHPSGRPLEYRGRLHHFDQVISSRATTPLIALHASGRLTVRRTICILTCSACTA